MSINLVYRCSINLAPLNMKEHKKMPECFKHALKQEMVSVKEKELWSVRATCTRQLRLVCAVTTIWIHSIPFLHSRRPDEMFYLKFPQLGPEKTIIYTSIVCAACLTIAWILILTCDYPSSSPKLFTNPALYRGFRLFLVINLGLSFPAIMLPVGCALKVYRAHPLLAYPFTLINICDLLAAFGYIIFYLPFLYMRVTGNARAVDYGVNSASIAMPIIIYVLKITLQTTAYSTIHKCVEEMCRGRLNPKYRLDSLHAVLNLLVCFPEKMCPRSSMDLVEVLSLCRNEFEYDEEMAMGAVEAVGSGRLQTSGTAVGIEVDWCCFCCGLVQGSSGAEQRSACNEEDETEEQVACLECLEVVRQGQDGVDPMAWPTKFRRF